MLQISRSLYYFLLYAALVLNWASSSDNSESEEKCGLPAFSGGQGKIVNGEDAYPGQFPWQALLLKKTNWATLWICGGTLIYPKWVVTAAHCLNGESESQLEVLLGVNDVTRHDEDFRQKLAISNNTCHEEFDPVTFAHDICLLNLDHAATYTNFVRPACLPPMDTVLPTGTSCTISGWGTTSENGQTSDILQYAQVDIIDHQTCNIWYLGIIPADHICAGFAEGGIDTCQGDSGGPLVCKENVRNSVLGYVLRGVTSFGAGCARAKKPGVYTQVVKYIDWINQVISARSAHQPISNDFVLIALSIFTTYFICRLIIR